MAHLNRAQPDATWARGYLTVGADLRAIDQNSFVAVNGDAGGTWTPAADLNIGGAGMVAAAPWTVSGLTALVQAPTFGKGTADDYFGLGPTHPGRSWTLVQVLGQCYATLPEQAVAAPGSATTFAGVSTTAPAARFLVPVRVYGGATLESVLLRFYITSGRALLPTTLTQMRIIAVDAFGVAFPLGAGANTDANGFRAISAATTGGGWSNGGSVQTFTYVCSQGNVVDLAKFTYWLEIIEETGPVGAFGGNTYVSATSFLDGIALFDGRN